MKNKSLAFLSLLYTLNATGQEMLGIVNSNFSGNIGITLNPASVVGTPFGSEINFFSIDISAHNNYLYIPAGEHGLSKLITGQGLSHDNAKDYYTVSPDKQMYANVFLLGPSVLFSTTESGWAFHTALRTNMSVQHLNYHIAKFLWEGFDYEPQHDIFFSTNPYQFTMLQWYELGYTYGVTLMKTKTDMLTVGGTFNLNLGANSAYIIGSKMDYIVPSSDTLIVYDLTGLYGHTITTNDPGITDYIGVKGIGGGINMGVQYCKDRNEKAYNYNSRNRRKYKWKAGVSLIDAGMIHYFNKSRELKFKNNSTIWPGIDTVKFDGINAFDETLNNQFTGTPDGALNKTSLNVLLPTAASTQFDYNIYNDFYANFTWIQRLAFFEPQVQRANQLSLTFRYETSKFEVALPYTYYEYYKHRLGLAFRYKWFFLGTDKFGPIIDAWDVDGIDLYFGIKINNHKSGKSGKRNKDYCPAYN